MNEFQTLNYASKEKTYAVLLKQITSLVEHETDTIANLANIVAILKLSFPTRFSWAGFYIFRLNELVLGPFQGKPACVRIPLGKGVCGSAALTRATVIVPDVHEFPGHIVCDADTRSEIVVPILYNDSVLGVIDIDSAAHAAFNDIDARYLEQIATIIAQRWNLYYTE